MIAPSLMAGLALGRIGCLLNGCCYGGETDRPWAVTFPQQSMIYLEQVAEGRTMGLKLAPMAVDNPQPVVLAVDANSTAEEAGVEPGTKIAAINGTAVRSIEDLQNSLVIAFQQGLPVEIKSTTGETYDIPILAKATRSLPVHPTQIYSAVQAALLAWLLWSFYPFRRRDGEVIALMLVIYPIARFSARDHPHRRSCCVWHRAEYLAKYQHRYFYCRPWFVGTSATLAPKAVDRYCCSIRQLR